MNSLAIFIITYYFNFSVELDLFGVLLLFGARVLVVLFYAEAEFNVEFVYFWICFVYR